MSQLKLMGKRRFLPMFTTQFLGAFNDNFFKNALVILITFQGVSLMGLPAAQLIPMIGGVFIIPFFLFSATSGQIADKFEKSKLIRIIKLAEIGIMVLASIGFLTGHYELLMVTVFLLGCHSTVFGPIKFSILPQHLSEEELVGGNALVEAGTFLAILLGTIAGGVLIGTASGALIVSSGIVAVAVAGYLTSRQIPKAAAVDPDLKIQWNPIKPTIEMIRFAQKTRSVFLSILAISWFWFFGAVILSLLPPYCKEFLSASEGVVTLFLAVFSIGIAAGSMCCEMLSRERLELGIVPIGSLGMSVFLWDLFRVGNPGIPLTNGVMNVQEVLAHSAGIHILADLFLLAFFSGIFTVPLYTLIQQRSEPSHRSRIIAGNNIINALFMVLGSVFLMGMIRAKLSIPQMFLTLSIVNAIVATYIYTVVPEFCLRFLIWCVSIVMYRMKVTGHANLPKEGPAVVVSNHVSFVDWMLLAAAIKRPMRFVMDASFAKGPMKILIRQAKVIPIASKNAEPEVFEAAFRKVNDELKAGEVVCIFPEGKITHDGQLNEFKKGIEWILRDNPVPVVPCAIINMWGSFFSRKGGPAMGKSPKRFWSRVAITISPAVPPSKATAAYLEEKVAGLLGTGASEKRSKKKRTA